MQVVKYPSKEKWSTLLQRPLLETDALNQSVRAILDEIQLDGDRALKKFSAKFDGCEVDELLVSETEIDDASKLISSQLKDAIDHAAQNIECFHAAQKQEIKKIQTAPGVTCWQKSVGIDKVGLYIPGGTAPLFSTVLMLAIPARIAQCQEIVLCTPPRKDGTIDPAILYAASVAGATKIYKLGGVQAIGAMAYGTESVPKVYKIFGPGNQYVMAAKQLVSTSTAAIDMPAGPSEVAVVANDYAKASFVASDLLSQAEHGIDSQAILFTTSEPLIQEVLDEIETQLSVLPREEFARKAVANSKIFLLENEDQMIDICNAYAPEHLIIATDNYMELAEKVVNAGSVFLGNYTPESAGDYASGTNHTLPTNGWANAYSGVNLDSFVKKITFQEITKEGIQNLAPTIEVMAEAEHLFAHKNAATLRKNDK